MQVAATTLVKANVFLTHAFSYDVDAAESMKRGTSEGENGVNTSNGALQMPQTELFDIWQRQRNFILEFLDLDPVAQNRVLEEAVDAATNHKGKACRRMSTSVREWVCRKPGYYVPKDEMLEHVAEKRELEVSHPKGLYLDMRE